MRSVSPFLSWVCASSCLLLSVVPVCAAQSGAARTRAESLVARMTLEEKISQMHGSRDAGDFRVVAGLPRLGIPPLRVTNGPAGVGPGGSGPQLRATALPAPIALAATWDPEAAFAYGKLAGEETLALGSDLLEAPDINIVRIPQGGRTFESYSEDPWLTSRLAVANIRGIQSAGVLGNVKHYLANNQEIERGSINEVIGQRALREIYMPAFEASVKEASVDSIMCAYPRVNGAFNCENAPLLTQVLKQEWKFNGFTMSDFGAVHSTANSLQAGLDLEMPTGQYFGKALAQAVKEGKVSEARIDEALVRRYTAMIERGIFDRPQVERRAPQVIPAFEHGAVARRIAEQGMVLLKNDGGLLPLDARKLQSVALIGPGAVRAKTGGGGSSYVNPLYTVRPEDGIYSRMQSQRHLTVLDGADVAEAARVAKKAQVAIVMVGDDEGEDHDHSLSLPLGQDALVEAVAAANPRTIVVLKSGSAVLMPWIEKVPAVLEAWYPGEEDGDAVARVLFGEVEVGGRLPITFPRSVEDTLAGSQLQYPGKNGEVQYSEGLAVGYRGYRAAGKKPLYPFGFGLSYTQFSYTEFLALVTGEGCSQKVEISFRVSNTGARAGSDVAQIYLTYPEIAEGNEPQLQLKAFQKIFLDSGATQTVRIALDARALAYWSESGRQWKTAKGKYGIALGRDAETMRAQTYVAIDSSEFGQQDSCGKGL
jgi:beta-glucosidase